MELIKSKFGFKETMDALEDAVKANGLGIVSKIDAQANLKKIGMDIRGNAILEVFSPKYAKMLFNANIKAGIEPPLRIYIFDDNDGTHVEYYKPSEIFSKWNINVLNELDSIFNKIMGVIKVTD